MKTNFYSIIGKLKRRKIKGLGGMEMENITTLSQESWDEFCEIIRNAKSEDMEEMVWTMKEGFNGDYDEEFFRRLWYAIREDEQK